jgi:GT2 family glycosyltransferase
VPLFSFLLPTRSRRKLVLRFLQSLVDTAHRIDEIEVVLCVDDDDVESHDIQFDPVAIRTVMAPPGVTMGELNRRCFDASTGRFVMLINDDVVIRTRNWDREVYSAFASFGDDIGLIHTNDLLFRDKLCTFPILSREACQVIGVCPQQYRRYRIDDHIYDTYNILALLGYRRIMYLPDVVFEHLNHQLTSGEREEKFVSDEGKVYVPNPEILESDALLFDSWIESRKQDAMKLAGLIERQAIEKRRIQSLQLLESVKDRFSYRRPDFVQVRPMAALSEPSKNVTVTVAVCTSNLYEPHAQKCLSLLKKHTTAFDLIILDNNGGANFNHPLEMNRAIRMAKTDFLVVMDDDVFVEEGWLDGLLKSLDADTGVVGPLHKDKDGKLSHAGVYLMDDEWGTHAHLLDTPDKPRVSQCLCSACLLIDLRKVGGVYFDTRYSKYFLDLDYSLKVWEAGYKVVCTPHSTVTHLGGATMPHGSSSSLQLWNKDIQIFAADWIRSGRLEQLQDGFLSRFPFLSLLRYIPRQIRTVFRDDTWEFSSFAAEASELENICRRLPLFQGLLLQEATRCLAQSTNRGDNLRVQFCNELLDRLNQLSVHSSGPAPLLVDSYLGYNLVQYLNEILAIPQSLGQLNLTLAKDRLRPGILSAPGIEQVKSLIDEAKRTLDERLNRPNGNASAHEIAASQPGNTASIVDGRANLTPPRVEPRRYGPPSLALEGYKQFNIIAYGGAYYAILQSDGAFDPMRLAGNYTCLFTADTLAGVKTLIDRAPWTARLAFRLKPILVKQPLIWRTAQKVNNTFLRGGSS